MIETLIKAEWFDKFNTQLYIDVLLAKINKERQINIKK